MRFWCSHTHILKVTTFQGYSTASVRREYRTCIINEAHLLSWLIPFGRGCKFRRFGLKDNFTIFVKMEIAHFEIKLNLLLRLST